MNHAYRLVWNQVRRLWQCAPEFTRARGKSASEKTTLHPVGAAATSEVQVHHLRGQFVLRTLITALLMSGASGSVWAACTAGVDYTLEGNTYTFLRDCNGDDGSWIEHDALKINGSGEYIINGNGKKLKGGNATGNWRYAIAGGDAIEIDGVTLRISGIVLEGGNQSSGTFPAPPGASINATDSTVIVEGGMSLLSELRFNNSTLTLKSGSAFNNNKNLTMDGGSFTAEGGTNITTQSVVLKNEANVLLKSGSQFKNTSSFSMDGGSFTAEESASITIQDLILSNSAQVNYVDPITINGNVEIKDASTSLVLKSGSQKTGGNLIVNGGSFTAESGASVAIQDLILSNNAQVNYVDPITINGNVEIKDENTSFVLKSGSQKTGGNLIVNGGSFTAEDNVSLAVNNLHLENAEYHNNNQMTINGDIYLKNIEGFVLKTGSQKTGGDLTVNGGSFTAEDNVSLVVNNLHLENAEYSNNNQMTINGDIYLENIERFVLKTEDVWATGKNLTVIGGSFTADSGTMSEINDITLTDTAYHNENALRVNGNINLTGMDFTLKSGDTWATGKNLTVNGGLFTAEEGKNITTQNVNLTNGASVLLKSGSQFKNNNTFSMTGGTFTAEEGVNINFSGEQNVSFSNMTFNNATKMQINSQLSLDRVTDSTLNLEGKKSLVINGSTNLRIQGIIKQEKDNEVTVSIQNSSGVVFDTEVRGGFAFGRHLGQGGAIGIYAKNSQNVQIQKDIIAGNATANRNGSDPIQYFGGDGVFLVSSSATISSSIKGGEGNNLENIVEEKNSSGGGGDAVYLSQGSHLTLLKGARLQGGNLVNRIDNGGQSKIPRTGAAVYFSGSRNTLELQSSDITLVAGQSTAHYKNESSNPHNNPEEKAKLRSKTLSSDNGTNNALILSGNETTVQSLDASRLNEGGDFHVFNTLEKKGTSIWKLSNELKADSTIASITVSEGGLALDASAKLKINGTTSFAAGTTLDIDKEVVWGNDNTLTLAENMTLKTNASSLDASGAGWGEKVNAALNTVGKSKFDLYTTEAFHAMGEEGFRSWSIGGASSTATLGSLATTNTIATTADLAVKDFNLASLKASGKTINNIDGTLKFSGNVDLSAADGEDNLSGFGLTKTDGNLAFAKDSEENLAILEVSVDQLNTLIQNTSDKQNAIIKTTNDGGFNAASDAAHKVSDFAEWQVASQGSTVTGAANLAEKTTITANGSLTATGITLGEHQTLKNTDGGSLLLTGTTHLDNGTLTIAASDTKFDANTILQTNTASGSALSGAQAGLANIQDKNLATIETLNAFAADDGTVAEFGTWKISASGSTAQGVSALAKMNEIGSGADLTLKDFTLEALQDIEKSINNNNGILKLTGNVDLSAADDATELANLGISNTEGNVAFAKDGDTLASLTVEADNLNTLIQNTEGKDNAFLKTTGSFAASSDAAHQVSEFAEWQINGAGSTATDIDSLAAVNTIGNGADLTLKDFTLEALQDSEKTINNENGILKLTGDVDLSAADGEDNLSEFGLAKTDGNLAFAKDSDENLAILEVNVDKLNTLIQNTGDKKNAVIKTTNDGGFNAASDAAHKVSDFAEWQVASQGSTVTGAANLAEKTTITADGSLTATGITLGETQTLQNSDGALVFAGTTNLDSGTLTLQENSTTAFQEGATLETSVLSGAAIQTGQLAGTKVTGKDKATLRTLSAFDATDGFAGEFKNWEVKGAGDNTTSALAQRKTTIAEGVNLTASITALGEKQTVDNSGKLILNTVDATRILANRITGSGEVIKQGAGTATLATGSHEYTGATQVDTGTLSLEKQTALSGGIHVAQGATLDLSLAQSELVAIPAEPQPAARMRRMARSLSAASTAAATPSLPDLAPGVTHQVTSFSLDGILNVVVNGQAANQHSHLHSLGDITLGSTSSLVINAAAYADGEGSVNDLLTSDTKVTGTFGAYSDNSALFDFTPTYTDKSVSLAVKKVEQIIDEGGGTGTDTGGGTGSDTGGGTGENHGGRDEPTSTPTLVQSYRGVLPITRLLDKAMNQDAESPLAQRFYALQTKAQARQTAVEIQPLLGGTGNRVIAEASDLMQRYVPNERCGGGEGNTSAWAHGLGDWGQQDGHQGVSGYQSKHYGIALGGDVCLNPRTKVGLMAAYVNTKAEAQDIHASQTLKADTWQVGVYANHAFTDRVDVDFMAAVGRANIKGERRFSYYSDLKAKGDTHADILRTGAGLNLRYQAGNTELSPYARLDYTQVSTKGYTETGAKEFNLNVAKQRTQALMAGVGLKVTHAVSDGLSLKAKAGVAYDLLDKGHDVQATLTSLPNQPFTIKHNKLGRTVGEVGLGMRYQASKSTSLSAEVQALFSKGRTDTTANVGVRVQF